MAGPIPQFYHFILTIFEPAMAVSGALQVLFFAKSYIELTNPNSVHLWNPAQQSIMTQISGGWFLIAFNDIFILRANRTNVKLWNKVLLAHVLSDVIYCYAMIQDIGVNRFANPLMWTTSIDWIVAGTTILGLGAKIGFLLGIGVGAQHGNVEQVKIE